MKSRKKWNTEEVKVPDRTMRQDSPGYRVFSRLGVEEVGALRLRSVRWDYLTISSWIEIMSV